MNTPGPQLSLKQETISVYLMFFACVSIYMKITRNVSSSECWMDGCTGLQTIPAFKLLITQN